MANYYRRFIRNYSQIVSPLHSLLRKDKSFDWTEYCEQSFQTIKNALISAPVLSYANSSKPFILTCDASNQAISYILGQEDDEGKEYVICYGGKSLTLDERKWSTEKECYAVIKGIEAYRPYLAGTHFTIITDHRALVWLQTAKHTGRLERWAFKIQYLNFDIVHRPGKSNVVADCLSRRPYDDSNSSSANVCSLQNDIPCDEDGYQREVTFVYANDPEDSFPSISALEVGCDINDIIGNNTSLSELQKNCDDFKEIYAYLYDKTLPDDTKTIRHIISESAFYSIQNNVLYHWYQRRCRNVQEELRHILQIALPKCLRLDALKSYHDFLAGGGHLGVEKCRSSLLQSYWWPAMHADVVEYIKSCDRCQRAKKKNYDPNKPPRSPMPQAGTFYRSSRSYL